MKSNRNFHKAKKSDFSDEERNMKIKKVVSGKKKKNFKQEILAEIDEDEEEFDLFGRNEDSFDEDTED